MDASSHLARYYCSLVCMTDLRKLCRQTRRCASPALGGPDELEEHACTRPFEVLSALYGNTVVSCDFIFLSWSGMF